MTTDVIRFGLMAGYGGVRAFHKRCFWGFNEHCPGKKEVRLFGITDLVKKHFFHKKWSPMAISGHASKDRDIQGGSERGKKVDQQLTKWHRLKSDPKTRQSTLDKFRVKADRYTNMVLDALESKGWTILSTQASLLFCHGKTKTSILSSNNRCLWAMWMHAWARPWTLGAGTATGASS